MRPNGHPHEGNKDRKGPTGGKGPMQTKTIEEIGSYNMGDVGPENKDEGYEAMQARAKEKAFTFPYLVDEGQKIYPQYGAVRTPHVFLRKVQYIGR